MRWTLALLSVASLAAAAVSLPAWADGTTPPRKTEVRLEFIHVEMTGVEGPEVEAVAHAISAIAGVKSVDWTAKGVEAKVVREVGTAPDEAVFQAIRTAGAATAARVPLALSNFKFQDQLHCGGCVAAVNQALLAMKGVKSSTVNVEMTVVSVVYDTRAVKPTDITASLTALEKPATLVPR